MAASIVADSMIPAVASASDRRRRLGFVDEHRRHQHANDLRRRPRRLLRG
jgi:hypothetical protein